ncbi:MAG: triose-phosphate isomerase [Proteobacteria bacterium]|nr:triose-phosphate isomerase [Pseudomonadota bacterium]
MKKIIAGNWKMNGSAESLTKMLDALRAADTAHATVIVCPPFPYLGRAAGAPVAIGAQDVSTHDSGTYTGEVSAAMLHDVGAKYVIVGHSDRRQNHHETNEIVAAKAASALKNELIPIICINETREDRLGGHAKAVVEKMVRESIPDAAAAPNRGHAILAYEPIWAISTGVVEKTDNVRATTDDIREMHAHIAGILESMGLGGMTILYGGSAKAANAAEILAVPHVGGVLVGGASLKPEDFVPIIAAAK